MPSQGDTQSHLAELFAGRFTVGEAMAWNGLALVHAARSLERDVALAVLPLDCEGDRSVEADFRRQMKAAAAMRHYAFVPIADVGVQHSVPFVAYERDPRPTLQSMLEGPLARPLALTIARKLLRALRVAHSAGLHHGDLTPSNVLVGKGDDVRIVGLGFAPLVRKAHPDRTGPTGRGSGPKAIRYLAPEVIAGRPGDAPTCDVYSIGALLHRMLTGEAPGRGAIRDGDEAGLAALVERALSPEPARRFRSAEAMEEALLEAMGLGEPKPTSVIPKAKAEPPEAKDGTNRRALAGAAVVACAGILAALVIAQPGVEPIPDEIAEARVDQTRESENAPADGRQPEREDEPSGGADIEPSAERDDHDDEGAHEASADGRSGSEQSADGEPSNAELDTIVNDSQSDAPVDGLPEGDDGDADPPGESGLDDASRAFLVQTRARIENGLPLTEEEMRPIYGWIQRHQGEPAGHLLLAHAFVKRGWFSAAAERYRHLFRLDAEVTRSAAQTLPDLIAIGTEGDDLVDGVYPLLRNHYAPDALAPLAAIAQNGGRRERQRAARLKRRLDLYIARSIAAEPD
ncbi:MAG: protein kinase [Myxococcota bacterium]